MTIEEKLQVIAEAVRVLLEDQIHNFREEQYNGGGWGCSDETAEKLSLLNKLDSIAAGED